MRSKMKNVIISVNNNVPALKNPNEFVLNAALKDYSAFRHTSEIGGDAKKTSYSKEIIFSETEDMLPFKKVRDYDKLGGALCDCHIKIGGRYLEKINYGTDVIMDVSLTEYTKNGNIIYEIAYQALIGGKGEIEGEDGIIIVSPSHSTNPDALRAKETRDREYRYVYCYPSGFFQ